MNYTVYGVLLLLSPFVAVVVIVRLIVRHRTKVKIARIERENDRAALEKIIDSVGDDVKPDGHALPAAPPEVGGGARKIKMNCQKCGASTDLDTDRQILFCPFCGAKELLIESDYIKEARIKASMNEKLAEEKRRTANELFEQYRGSIRTQHSEERKDKTHRFLRSAVSIALLVIVACLIMVGFFYFIIVILPWMVQRVNR